MAEEKGRKWIKREKKRKKMNDKEKIDNYRGSTNKMQKQGLTVEKKYKHKSINTHK